VKKTIFLYHFTDFRRNSEKLRETLLINLVDSSHKVVEPKIPIEIVLYSLKNINSRDIQVTIYTPVLNHLN